MTSSSVVGRPPHILSDSPDRASVRVRLARTHAEVEALRTQWSSYAIPDIDADIDYFMTVVHNAAEVLSPYVIVIERHEQDPILVVARLARQSFPVRVGYLDLFAVTAQALVVSFDGILGAETAAEFDLALDVLAEQVRHRAADLLVLQKVTEGSELAAAFGRRSHVLTRVGEPVIRWTTEFPDSLDALLEQRSTSSRRGIRRHLNSFRKHYAARSTFRSFPDGDVSAEDLANDINAVSRLSYQSRLQLGSSGDELLAAQWAMAAKAGTLRATVLVVDERPVAFFAGIRHQRALASFEMGYDPAFGKDGLGFICMMKAFENMCTDPSIERMDFGYGDAAYKQRFATGSTMARDHLIFSWRPRSLMARLVLSVGSVSRRATHALLARSDLVRKIKKSWRAGGQPAAAETTRAGEPG